MSTATTHSPDVDDVEHADHVDHPSDLKYVKVALFLGFVTALEVATYFFDMSTTALVATLVPMMVIKFGTVIFYFMHLKYDNPLFKRVFLFGLVLAVIVFLVALTSFEYWDDRYFRFLRGD